MYRRTIEHGGGRGAVEEMGNRREEEQNDLPGVWAGPHILKAGGLP